MKITIEKEGKVKVFEGREAEILVNAICKLFDTYTQKEDALTNFLKFLRKPVNRFSNYSVNIRRVFIRAEINTVEELCCWSEEQLLRLRNFGPNSLKEVIRNLKRVGRKLGD